MIKTEVEIYPCDLTGRDNCFKLFDTYKDQDIEVLVNASGFGLFGNTWETDINKELKMIDLNITAVHILSKLFLQEMMKKNKGYIMNVASSAGFLAGPYLNTYYASKNYVTKWTMGMYEELRRAKSNVKVCALCPGPVDTNFNNVAGGSFTVKALSSEYVARYAVDKMFKNKLIIIPGFTVRLGVFFNKFLPLKTSLKIVYNIQKGKAKGVNKDV
jgi:short-subunit dehydrogenase